MTGELTGEGGPARRRAGSAWVTDDPEDRTGNTRDRDSQRAVLLEIIRFRFAAAVVIGACIALIPAFGPYRVVIGGVRCRWPGSPPTWWPATASVPDTACPAALRSPTC